MVTVEVNLGLICKNATEMQVALDTPSRRLIDAWKITNAPDTNTTVVGNGGGENERGDFNLHGMELRLVD